MASTALFLFASLAFITAILIYKTNAINSRAERASFSIGWVLFAFFWISRLPYYIVKTKSLIYTIIIPIAILVCILFAYTIVKQQSSHPPDGYINATIGTTIASLIYLPFSLFEPLRKLSIEIVASQTYQILQLLGVQNVTLKQGPEYGYQSALQFTRNNEILITYIAPNCTGIGSIAALLSVLWITNLKLKKKFLYSILGVLLIHILNLGRNVLIALGYGNQWFTVFDPLLAPLLGYSDPNLVSFFIADKLLAQAGSAISLLLIFYIFLTKFPELRYLLTNLEEYFTAQLTNDTED